METIIFTNMVTNQIGVTKNEKMNRINNDTQLYDRVIRKKFFYFKQTMIFQDTTYQN